MKTIQKFFILIGIVWGNFSIAQNKVIQFNLSDLSEKGQLEIWNREVSSLSMDGKKCIRFSQKANDGLAWIKDLEFSNGIIEVDIKGKNILQQSFVGIAFHGLNNETYDAVYFRPFNFQSTDPVRVIHAVQYVSQPDFTWQVLREKHSGQYEKAVIPAPNGDEWFHAKIVVSFPNVTVFVNGSSTPSLKVDKLDQRKTGKIGLWVGNGSDGDFANLKITFN